MVDNNKTGERKLSAVLSAMLSDIHSPNLFFAHLLIQMVQEETKKVPTMGVRINNGTIYLAWNPDWLETLIYTEIVAVFTHECEHIVCKHIERAKEMDHYIGNIAMDMAINQLITGLPKGGVDYKAFNFPPNLNLEQYYALLLNMAQQQPKPQKGQGKGQGQGDQKGEGEGQGENGEGAGDGTGKLTSITAPNGQKQTTVDTHDGFGESQSELDQEVLKQAVREAVDKVAKAQGTLPSNMEEYIKEWLKEPTIPWQRLLKAYISNSVKCGRKSSWKRQSRRCTGLPNGMVLKGKVSDHVLKMVVAIDTSGSISGTDLGEFCSEIEGIRRCYKSDITIMECDADVQKQYTLKKFNKIDTKFKGRGGTDFRPVFDRIKQNHINPDLLIYQTDLCGTYPDTPPNYKVLWLTPSSTSVDFKPPFGRRLDITPSEKVKR